MNRIDRVTAILIQLQSKRTVKAQDIADRFEISLRTVYRDIKTLEEAGIPIIGETGIGYSLVEGYRLPPVMFTKEEATAFLTAEKLVEKLTDASTSESYKSAMYKIKAVLKSTEQDYLETIDKHIEVIPNPYLPDNRHETNHLQLILKSISSKTILAMHYFANHSRENTERKIEPIGIFYLGRYWHLIAFCHLRNDYRDFRLDRITQITPTDTSYKKQHPTLNSYLKQVSKEKDLHTVVMKVDKKVIQYFGDQKYYNGFISERELEDEIEMTFLTSSLEGFARWFIMYGDCAEIVTPDSLRIRIKELALLIAGR